MVRERYNRSASRGEPFDFSFHCDPSEDKQEQDYWDGSNSEAEFR